MSMPLDPGWYDIATRLVLTVIAGALLGLNRESRGHAAGLRTTILVGLAAAVAMIQANILLGVGGKAPDSFGVMDVARFPLGVLTGVGFIGGGAILKRGDLVTGVTTAATLWIMTAIGLAFGGGQVGLGVAATLLTLFTLLVLKWIDLRIPREHHATLALAWKEAAVPDIDAMVRPLGYRARFIGIERRGAVSVVSFAIRWIRADMGPPPMDLLAAVARTCEIERFEQTSDPMR